MAEIIKQVNIIGAGLAGSEAAYQLARRGVPVDVYKRQILVYNYRHRKEESA